jgi:hypothetical protein
VSNQPNKLYHQALTANRKLLEQVKELQTNLHPVSNHTEYTPCPGQDANGTTKHFVTIKKENGNTTFLTFNGQLLRFDTATDCLTFCSMLNSCFITQTFSPNNNKPAKKTPPKKNK